MNTIALFLLLAAQIAAPSAHCAETLDPVHKKLVARIEAARAELKQVISSKVDATLVEAIGSIREADAYYLSQHGGKFSSTASGAADDVDNDNPASEDASEQLLDVRDELKDYLTGKWGGHIGKAEKALKTAVTELRHTTTQPKVAPVPTNAHHAWWSTDYSHFLTTEEDETHRRMLWTYFFSAEELAHRFALAPDQWVPIIGVALATGQNKSGEWSTSGKITVKGDNGPGVIFHEIFHTAYQKSAFRQSGDLDRKWNEGFCDAFRYAAEHVLMSPPYSSWSAKIERLETLPPEKVAQHKDKWFLTYGYPAALIVKRSGGTFDGLLALWRKLSDDRRRHGDGVLNQYFGWTAGIKH